MSVSLSLCHCLFLHLSLCVSFCLYLCLVYPVFSLSGLSSLSLHINLSLFPYLPICLSKSIHVRLCLHASLFLSVSPFVLCLCLIMSLNICISMSAFVFLLCLSLYISLCLSNSLTFRFYKFFSFSLNLCLWSCFLTLCLTICFYFSL